MRAAHLCQEGGTEKNPRFIKALFRMNRAVNPTMVPVGKSKSQRREPPDIAALRAQDVRRVGENVNRIFTQGLTAKKGKPKDIPEVVIILWDTDCHDNLPLLRRQLCEGVKQQFRERTFVYFAHPEPEIWILADVENCLNTVFESNNARAIHEELRKKGVQFSNLEAGLQFDKQRRCCRTKVSKLLQGAIKNTVGKKFSKKTHFPALMEHIDWKTVADALPTFKPLYDDWLAPEPATKKSGGCGPIQ